MILLKRVKKVLIALFILSFMIIPSIASIKIVNLPESERFNENQNPLDYYKEHSDLFDVISDENGFTRIAPKAADYYKTHVHYENISSSIDCGFDAGTFAETGWTPDYTFSSDSSGAGSIYIDQYNGKNCVFLKGEKQKRDIGNVHIPELPEDMSINSGNLWNEEYHHFGGGTLHVHFYPNNIKTIVEWTITYINGVPVPTPSMVYVNTFYIYIRTDPSAAFSNPIYTYSLPEYEECQETYADIGLHDLTIDHQYFEISLRAFLWDDTNWVAIDYCRFDSYNIKVEEAMDNDPTMDNHINWDYYKNQNDPYGIPSNYDQNLTIEFTSYENIELDKNSVEVYVNPSVVLDKTLPDPFYDVVPGQINETCQHFKATLVSGYTFKCTIPREVYVDGDVGYRIRFTNQNGKVFWTPSFSFHAYDREPPTVDLPITYDPTPEYQYDLQINFTAHDTGGAHLKRATIYYGASSFDDKTIEQIEDMYSHSGITVYATPDEEGIYPDDQLFTAYIPSTALDVKQTQYFCIVVEDRAGNKNIARSFTIDAQDHVPPSVSLFHHSFREVNNDDWAEPKTRNVSDLGYPLKIIWLVNEPVQAAGLDTIIYGITGESDTKIAAPSGIDDFTGNKTKIDATGELNKLVELYNNMSDYSTQKWFQVAFFANDTWGNEYFTYYDLYIDDVRPPDVSEGENNTIAPNFNEDFVLTFSCWEPSVANGVDNSSFSFQYYIYKEGVNEPIDSYVEFHNLGNTLTKVDAETYVSYYDDGWGYNLTFRIPQTQYDYGDIIYYEFKVSDLGGNTYYTTSNAQVQGSESMSPDEVGLRVYPVADRIPPILQINPYDKYTCNYTVVYSYFDVGISVNITDQEEDGGSGIDTVKLYFVNNSNFISFRYNHTWPSVDYYSLDNTTNTYYFVIPEEYFTIDEENPEDSKIYFCLYVTDKAGNVAQWTHTENIYDSNKPNVIDYSYDAVDKNQKYVPTLTPRFYFKLDIPSYVYFTVDDVPMMVPTEDCSNISTVLSFTTQGPHIIRVYFNDFRWEREIIIDTIAPGQVTSVSAEKKGGDHVIKWERPEGLDPDEPITYYIYRGNTPDFTANGDTLIAKTTDTEYKYHFDVTGTFYYKVRAVDAALNMGEVSPASNKVASVASSDVGAIVGGVVGAAAVVLVGWYMLDRYQKFYGLQDKKQIIAQRLKIRKRYDFTSQPTSAETVSDVKSREKLLIKSKAETAQDVMGQKYKKPARKFDEVRPDDLDLDQNAEGWEDDKDSGWE